VRNLSLDRNAPIRINEDLHVELSRVGAVRLGSKREFARRPRRSADILSARRVVHSTNALPTSLVNAAGRLTSSVAASLRERGGISLRFAKSPESARGYSHPLLAGRLCRWQGATRSSS